MGGGYDSTHNEEEKKLIKEEFDYEKNLAMFDENTVMAEIDAELGAQPDIVRLVHCNRLVAGQGGTLLIGMCCRR